MKLSVVVQAGGESRRMGRNKALVPFLGAPLIQRVVQRLAGLGDEMIVTSNAPDELAFLGLPCLPDRLPGRGALGGLHTALAGASHPWVAVVACDMPFAAPGLVRLCMERSETFDLIIPRTENGLEPLHALYRRDACLPEVERALDAGLWRVDAWFHRVRVLVLEPKDYAHLDPQGRTFLNVNTPEDLLIAEGLAQG
jgi:molybdopterin-guanine dinucleotide biosynthesis protein A